MARARKGDDERSMDSLLDALTNVVGILLLILIISSLMISQEVRKIVENLPEVSESELDQLKVNFESRRKDLQEWLSMQQQQDENEVTEDEAKQLAAELEEFEENNKDLTEKTSDLEEWKKKVEDQEEKKTVNEEEVKVAASELANLKAILDQTPKREMKAAKVVNMPNPRLAPAEAVAHFVVCKGGKLFYVGDPYSHVFGVRDVIDQKFAELAWQGEGIGSHTFALQGTRQNDARTGYLAPDETVRRNARFLKDLGWENIKILEINAAGTALPEKDILTRLFGNQDRRDISVHKFRLDEAKVKAYFGDGKFGPRDFSYFVSRNGTSDRLRLELGFKEEGGWTVDQFKKQGTEFDEICKKISITRGALMYFYVSPDSFNIYLEARDMTEAYKIAAGWKTWKGERFALEALPRRETTQINLDSLPDAEYLKIATALGPKLIASLKDEINKLDANVAAAWETHSAAVAAEKAKGKGKGKADKGKASPKGNAELTKEQFVAKLTTERREFIVRSLQPWARQIFETALAANEAGGTKEVRIDVHPPDIPHSRIFIPQKPPAKPKPPPDPNAPKPKPKAPTTGGTPRLILD